MGIGSYSAAGMLLRATRMRNFRHPCGTAPRFVALHVPSKPEICVFRDKLSATSRCLKYCAERLLCYVAFSLSWGQLQHGICPSAQRHAASGSLALLQYAGSIALFDGPQASMHQGHCCRWYIQRRGQDLHGRWLDGCSQVRRLISRPRWP